MNTVTLLKWGNSMGIRIPMAVAKQAGVQLGQKMQIMVNERNNIMLIPQTGPRQGWQEAFNQIADTGEDTMLLSDIESEFDEDDWQW